jgi:hypothetical protein
VPTTAELLTQYVADHVLQRCPGRIFFSGALAGVLAPPIIRAHDRPTPLVHPQGDVKLNPLP